MSRVCERAASSQTLDIEPTNGALFGGLFYSPGAAPSSDSVNAFPCQRPGICQPRGGFAYSVIDIGATLRIVRGVDAYARVMNLANRRYEEVLGFPALGRSSIVGVRIAASR